MHRATANAEGHAAQICELRQQLESVTESEAQLKASAQELTQQHKGLDGTVQQLRE